MKHKYIYNNDTTSTIVKINKVNKVFDENLASVWGKIFFTPNKRYLLL